MKPSQNRIYVVEKTIYTGYLDILEFTSSATSPEYFNFYNDPRHKIARENANLDLRGIQDLFLRRRIVEFLYSNLDPNKMNEESFRQYRIQPLCQIIKCVPDIISLPYNDFMCKEDEIVSRIKLGKAKVKSFLHIFYRFCNYCDHINNPFDLDVWDLSRFNLTRDRDYGRRFNQISFERINNSQNKFYIKKYIEYCLTNTGISMNTISGRLSALRTTLNLSSIAFSEWDQENTEQFIKALKQKYKDKQTIASRMLTLNNFAEYLIIHDFIFDNPLKKYKSLARIGQFKYKATAADEIIVKQLFSILDKIKDERIVLCFLIIYCVGMRVSEACSIQYNCTEKTKNGYFIKYYSLKMKKDVYNVIPESLYNKIESYKITIKKQEFLFQSQKTDKPMSPGVFYSKMNKEIKNFNILNPNGTLYRFAPHSFRHLMAVRMREKEIPMQFIQEQLHHNNVDMTMAYIEYLDKAKIEKMNQFINMSGEVEGFQVDFNRSIEIDYADYMRSFINAQMLPNGVCGRPIKLGSCTHNNCCLSCPEFRTSRKDLPVHKEHLQRTIKYIEIAKQNGWIPQINSNILIKEKLELIIARLEGMEND